MAVASSNVDGTTRVLSSGTSAKPETKTEGEYFLLALFFVAVGGLLGWYCSTNSSLHIADVAKLNAGISVFALVYVAAQVVERILVPIAPYLSVTKAPSGDAAPAKSPSDTTQATGRVSKTTARNALLAWSAACATPSADLGLTQGVRAAQTAVQGARGAGVDTGPIQAELDQKTTAMNAATEAATSQAKTAATWLELLNQARKNGDTTLWALASGLGMVVSGATNVHLIQILVSNWTHPTVDIIATGLVLGGGSKGLHDLITNLQDKGDSSGSGAAAAT